jgi:Response regulator containing CheY-like receiver, AAA-type ATPase, and DNA-binding domains
LLAHSASIKIFTLSGQDELSNARHARALGAIDFIAKPCAPEKIRQYLNEALSIQNTELSNAEQQGQLLGIVGQSPPIQTLRSQIIMYATMPFPVLIEGESGSGKELIAIALQQLGGNPSAPFKTLNCAAISPTLIESALFGHAKGSFTGAASAQSGIF